jgi:hypothetical protein
MKHLDFACGLAAKEEQEKVGIIYPSNTKKAGIRRKNQRTRETEDSLPNFVRRA